MTTSTTPDPVGAARAMKAALARSIVPELEGQFEKVRLWRAQNPTIVDFRIEAIYHRLPTYIRWLESILAEEGPNE